jgi:hypothetical protein
MRDKNSSVAIELAIVHASIEKFDATDSERSTEGGGAPTVRKNLIAVSSETIRRSPNRGRPILSDFTKPAASKTPAAHGTVDNDRSVIDRCPGRSLRYKLPREIEPSHGHRAEATRMQSAVAVTRQDGLLIPPGPPIPTAARNRSRRSLETWGNCIMDRTAPFPGSPSRIAPHTSQTPAAHSRAEVFRVFTDDARLLVCPPCLTTSTTLKQVEPGTSVSESASLPRTGLVVEILPVPSHYLPHTAGILLARTTVYQAPSTNPLDVVKRMTLFVENMTW